MANSHKANRLSSLLSLGHSRNDSASSQSQSSSASHPPDNSQDHAPGSPEPTLQSPSKHRLHKHYPSAGSSLPPLSTMTTLPALAPPPAIGADGLQRPPSAPGQLSTYSSGQASRDGSRSRPTTPNMLAPYDSLSSPRPQTPTSAKVSKRRSWLPGKADKSPVGPERFEPQAWIAGLKEHIPYNFAPLINGEKVPELWNENADTCVHLFPEAAGRGPSFKVDSILFAASLSLTQLLQRSDLSGPVHERDLSGNIPDMDLSSDLQTGRRTSNGSGFSRPASAYTNFSSHFSGTKHIYMPLEFDGDLSSPEPRLQGDDVELLVLYRNFFAYMLGGALVATPRQVGLYPIFMGIATIFRRFGFSNVDGSTFGELVSASFARYCDELRLADVRSSREKTIEAVVLGERMKSWPLYNEGFVHAAGKLVDMKQIESPKYAQISPVTRNRLERASIDLEGRLRTVRYKLEDFEFPSMFSGIANSQIEPESKMVRFKAWKAAFITFRKHIIAHYRQRYGAWPPKASSKKNNFEESGLNRLVLMEMYKDFCDLYDMLADRNSLTTRTIDMHGSHGDAQSDDPNESTQHAIRRVESEYDRSTPPVQPPMPFDVPLIPSLSASFNREHVLVSKTESKERSKRLKDNEVNEILLGSYNRDSMKATPWLEAFLGFERRTGHGKAIDDLADLRCGQWLLLYAILQALPMCVVDARDLKYTEGVEYLLCMAPRGGRPWMKEDTSQSRNWYNVASGGGMVSLPADVIDHGVEGVYRRSHCWMIAAQWAQTSIDTSPTAQVTLEDALPPPPTIGGRSMHSSPQGSPYLSPHMSPLLRPVSPALSEKSLRRNANRSSVALGLQEVAPPLEQAARPVSVHNPNLTFDTILGDPTQNATALKLKQDQKKKKKK